MMFYRYGARKLIIIFLFQWNEAVLERLNNILENFMGISDKDLGNFYDIIEQLVIMNTKICKEGNGFNICIFQKFDVCC